MAVQKINFLKSTVWPATIPLRNNFIHPAVFSRLALQAKMIFSSQPPCSEDPLVRWQDLFLPAQCPRDLFRRPSRCWRGMPTHSHPLSPGSRGAREPLFCRSPGVHHPARAGSDRPRAGGPHSASGRALARVGDSSVTAAGGSRAVSCACGAPTAVQPPSLRARGKACRYGTQTLPFPAPSCGKKGVFPRRSKGLHAGEERRRVGEAG